MKRPKLLFTLICLTFFATSVQSQSFSVGLFRVLVNDITAYITPVRDLNDEACALLKVVGNHDFVFSTPLGVVERRNETGEIWLYLPKGSIQITIKHPKWGVLRDYNFGRPLESRMTYELVISEPIEYKHPATMKLKGIPKQRFGKSETIHPVKSWEIIPFKRPKAPLHYLLMSNVGISSESWSAGIRLGMMRRHGGYLLYQSNFKSSPKVAGICNKEGMIDDGITPYYTGEIAKSECLIMTGGLHQLWNSLCLYEGLGFGKRIVAWESADNLFYENSSYTTKGLAVEAGLMWRHQTFVVSAGAMTLSGKHWEATIGIGIQF